MRISDWSSDVCSSDLDLLFGGRGIDQVSEAMRSRGIELVISDSEAWTHRVAQRLNLPRISFDHVGIIAYCKPHFPPDLWALGMRDGWGYRQLMGVPERILISSFYRAEPAYPQVHVVGPMLRSEEHTSELQSLMRISYAVFCLKKKKV